MSDIAITSNAEDIVRRLQAFPEAMAKAIEGALDAENQNTIGHISATKLSQRGPTTLGVRSNRLRSSVRATEAEELTDGTISSSIGSNVIYAGVHEHGIDQIVTVRQFTRRNSGNDRFTLTGRGSRKLAASGISVVKSHPMHMRFPARAMFRTGIEECAENYSASVSAAIIEAWQQGGQNG